VQRDLAVSHILANQAPRILGRQQRCAGRLQDGLGRPISRQSGDSLCRHQYEYSRETVVRPTTRNTILVRRLRSQNPGKAGG
jgi:hypothetical protein